jgi:glycosyltransferase involved in cell wall biosynthesis
MRLACATRMTQEKGAFVAVDLLRHLPSEARLVLIGDGPEIQAVRARAAALEIEGRIEMPGWLPQAEVVRVFAEADVVCFPSQCAESFGIVGIEAMSVARPVVAFDVGGQREWLEDGVTGLVARPATAEAMARTVGTLLADPERCRRMGEAGAERAGRLYDPDAHVARLLQILDGAAGRHASPAPA